jgi:hypothetical protein
MLHDINITLIRNVNPDVEKFVMEMAQKNQSIEYYQKNRNTTYTRAGINIFLGKKCEFIGSRALSDNYGYDLAWPDLEVRHGPRKMWHIDAYGKYHIKGCDSETVKWVGDLSWTFQLKNEHDDYGRDPMLDTDEGQIVLVYMEDHMSHEGIVKLETAWKDVKHLLKDPKLDKHKGKKICLYHKDLRREFGI